MDAELKNIMDAYEVALHESMAEYKALHKNLEQSLINELRRDLQNDE